MGPLFARLAPKKETLKANLQGKNRMRNLQIASGSIGPTSFA